MPNEKRKLEKLETKKARYGAMLLHAKQNGFVASDREK